MPITWNDLTVSFEHLDRLKLVEDWRWLIGATALPILISSVGDMFLQEESNEIYWLITGSAEYKKVAENYQEFQNMLQDDDLVNDWFLIPIVAQLKEKGIGNEPGKLYGFKQLPVLGGRYEVGNFELTDTEVYFAMSGQISLKIKDIPDGRKVKFTITEVKT